MRRALRITVKLTTLLGLLCCATGAIAESPQDLVGTWKGYRTAHTGGRQAQRINHSFTIKTVKEAEGKWEAEAVDGKGQPLPMTVSVADGVVHVEYAFAGESIRLALQKGSVLTGEARQQGVNEKLDVRLEKQAP